MGREAAYSYMASISAAKCSRTAFRFTLRWG